MIMKREPKMVWVMLQSTGGLNSTLTKQSDLFYFICICIWFFVDVENVRHFMLKYFYFRGQLYRALLCYDT